MSTSCRALTHLAHAIRRALHAQVLHCRPWRGSGLWTAAARTRLGVGRVPLVLRSRSIVQKDRAATGTAGSRSHDRKVRPSRGNAARRTALCRWTRRRFVFVSATITQALTASGSQRSLARDASRKPAFAVDRSDELLNVGDVGLQLDDEQGAPSRMPGQDVDDAALTVDRERNLRRKYPAGQCLQVPGGATRAELSARH